MAPGIKVDSKLTASSSSSSSNPNIKARNKIPDVPRATMKGRRYFPTDGKRLVAANYVPRSVPHHPKIDRDTPIEMVHRKLTKQVEALRGEIEDLKKKAEAEKEQNETTPANAGHCVLKYSHTVAQTPLPRGDTGLTRLLNGAGMEDNPEFDLESWEAAAGEADDKAEDKPELAVGEWPEHSAPLDMYDDFFDSGCVDATMTDAPEADNCAASAVLAGFKVSPAPGDIAPLKASGHASDPTAGPPLYFFQDSYGELEDCAHLYNPLPCGFPVGAPEDFSAKFQVDSKLFPENYKAAKSLLVRKTLW